MRVLMISLDKTLLGADYSGDVLERHKEYARYVDTLDIIVFCRRGFSRRKINEKLSIYPTNSFSKIFWVWDAYRIGRQITSHSEAKPKNPERVFHGILRFAQDDILVVTQDPFLTGLAGWLLKRKFKIPLLIHFHGDFWQNKYWLKEKWFNLLLLPLSKFLVRKADGLRVVSSGIKEKLVKAGIDRNKIRVIPTPVDLEKFENYDLEKVRDFREKQHQNKKTIINVGRLDSAKDYPTLFKAISLVYGKYRNLVFWQVGADFHLRGKIKADENLIFTSTGKIDQKELSNYYHASDIYVSSSCHESFGKVLVEAMACGLPVVATATTGSQEIVIDGENGFLVPIGQSQALAKKILYLLNNPEKAKAMGQAGKKMVKEKFDQQKIIQKIIKFWQDLTLNYDSMG